MRQDLINQLEATRLSLLKADQAIRDVTDKPTPSEFADAIRALYWLEVMLKANAFTQIDEVRSVTN